MYINYKTKGSAEYAMVLDRYISKSGFSNAIDAVGYRNPDTLHALLSYYILSPHANCHAQDWWRLTHAKFLYPKASTALRK